MPKTSKFMTDAKEMQEKLGHSLCLAKWQQTSLHLTTGHTASCYHPTPHKIDEKPLKFHPGKLHNTDFKKLQRKLMLEGERPEECSYCWAAEDNGQLSDRHYRSGEPWAKEHFEQIKTMPWDQDVIPSYVEVDFSNACNLACSYCSPQYSTEWAKDIKRWGAYPTSTPHNAPEHFKGERKPLPLNKNPFVDAFWDWWPELYPKLKHFRMTGGEPLMDRNTYRVFDYIRMAPKSDLHLDVTSNFSVPDKLYEEYISRVKELCDHHYIEHFMQYVSIDTGDKWHAEYIRDGLDYQKFVYNVQNYLSEIPGRNSITFIITMNNLSLVGLKELLQWILSLRGLYNTDYQRIWFDTPLLRSPEWQSIQILPESYQELLEEAIEFMKLRMIDESSEEPFYGFKDYEVQRMERNLAWMKQGTDNIERKRADFYRFFNEYDKRRRQTQGNIDDFYFMFPQMREFWDECKYHADNGNR